MNHIVEGIIITIVLAIIAGCCYGGWVLKRKVNYKMSYGAQVEAQCAQVMQEHINTYHKGEVK